MTTVCVTGMHRSGTSFAARALQLLGASLGRPDQLMTPGPDNPAGYWENRRLKELHDELLADLGGSWDQPPVLEPGWADDPGLEPWRTEARERLVDAFGSGLDGEGVIAWKDPRLSLLTPFWRTVLPIDATIVIVRHPLDVAASLARRNGIPAAQSSLLWLRYLLASLHDDPGALVVTQPAFFDDRARTLARLADHAGLPAPTAEVEAAVADHLDPGLLHPADHDGPTDPVTDLAREVWNDGTPEPDAVPATVARALAEGWWRPPADGELLTRARAKVMKLQATLQRRALQKKKLDAEREALERELAGRTGAVGDEAGSEG